MTASTKDTIEPTNYDDGRDSVVPVALKTSIEPKALGVHRFGPRENIVCDTESVGHATPQGRSPLDLIVDATEGFIPLWAPNTTLRWRFRESALAQLEDPETIRAQVQKLFAQALLAWGEAAPIKFTHSEDLWDFEIVVGNADSCSHAGCTLARAFFPDAGRHDLMIFPKMFEQVHQEQIETLVHEIGHIFGLRHFFAKISETQWASEVFGTQSQFTIMNYGKESFLTESDRSDLKELYALVWSGQLKTINGTPIRLMRPFHESGFAPPAALMAG